MIYLFFCGGNQSHKKKMSVWNNFKPLGVKRPISRSVWWSVMVGIGAKHEQLASLKQTILICLPTAPQKENEWVYCSSNQYCSLDFQRYFLHLPEPESCVPLSDPCLYSLKRLQQILIEGSYRGDNTADEERSAKFLCHRFSFTNSHSASYHSTPDCQIFKKVSGCFYLVLMIPSDLIWGKG